MRALFVTVAPPWPPNHALRIAHGQYLRALTEIADVTLVTWALPETTDDDRAALAAMSPDVVILPRRAVSLRAPARLGRRLAFLGGGLPPYARAMLAERIGALPELHAAITTRHRDRPFDVVVLTEELLGLLPLPDLGAPIVLHRWNVFHSLLGDLDALGGGGRPVRTAVARVEARGWRGYDRAVMTSADLVVVPTPEVGSAVVGLHPAARVLTIAHGVECSPLATAPSEGTDVAFVGAMDYRANEDAVEWFVRECWPAVRQEVPDASFRIVGRRPTRRVQALEGNGVHVVGEVPDVSAACEGVRVGVVPLRAGMGIKTKTLQLMAMGLPVVATPVGAEGIGATRDEGLIVAGGADIMAAAVAALLRDPARADRIGVAARGYAERHHSWGAARETYRQGLQLVADRDDAHQQASA